MITRLEQEDKIISEFLNSIGPWREHIIIGGGYALMIYKLYLADPATGNPPVGTRDIDSLISRQLPVVSKKNIANYLSEAGFTQFFKDYDEPATEAYAKEIDGCEVEIEFLTDASTRGDKNKNIVIAGVVAQPLSYLSLSLQMAMEFSTYAKERGMVVSPHAWIFHKGLTFLKRKSASKVYKDLYGIWYVATQLGGFSEEAVVQLRGLFIQYPKWFKKFQSNLLQWLENANLMDWSGLESQDPFRKIKKFAFERLVETLTADSRS